MTTVEDGNHQLDNLIAAIRAARGIPFAELFRTVDGVPKGADKALAHRQLLRHVGGVAKGDGTASVRTLPLDASGRVREPTKVCRIDFQSTLETPFTRSEAAEVLRRVLFVPIVKPHTQVPDEWSFGSPHLWIPTRTEWAQVGRDYDEVRAIVARGDADALSSSNRAGYGAIRHAEDIGAKR